MKQVNNPTLNEMAASRQMIDAFAGYNHNLRIGDTEFYDMQNMTSSYYPVLSPRGQRGVYEYPEGSNTEHKINGLISKDALCYVDGTKLFINNHEVAGLVLSDTPKQLVSMGAYIVIMPDKVYVNTKDFTDIGNIEATFTTTTPVTYEMCKVDGTEYTNAIKASTPPDPTQNTLWIDTSTIPNTLKQYSSANSVWSPIATTYIKISTPNIAASFKQYDAVKISGLPSDLSHFEDLEGKVSPLWEVYHDEGDADIGRAEGTDDYVVVVGFIDEVFTRETTLKLERKMPELDFIIESGNRLWGCRYGEDINGNIVNEIYASKLGDFKNWNCFMGLSTDSYTASCGTDGMWTGAITHLGYPLFFKENFVHKVYGNIPANFQIQSTACRGVQRGCNKSLAIVNETLFYKSRSGICAYDGSLPQEVSYVLGEITYSDAVASAHGNKYYVSMKDSSGIYHLFVFDVAKNMWHKEDNIQIDSFCSCDGELYFIDSADQQIKTMFGSGTKDTAPVKWMAETGVLGTDSPDKKYISRLNVRMALNVGTRVRFYIQYDSSGTWDLIFSMAGVNLRTFNVPIRPRRCDHMKLRIEGEGEAKIYSITKTIEQGSDM
ncbi:MAG: hypothetical protein II304_03365 [Bacteroidales bacterium]|nr:hypothetical protein [Bacteroidales bacterium]